VRKEEGRKRIATSSTHHVVATKRRSYSRNIIVKRERSSKYGVARGWQGSDPILLKEWGEEEMRDHV